METWHGHGRPPSARLLVFSPHHISNHRNHRHPQLLGMPLHSSHLGCARAVCWVDSPSGIRRLVCDQLLHAPADSAHAPQSARLLHHGLSGARCWGKGMGYVHVVPYVLL